MGLWALVSDSILSVHQKLSSKLVLRHVATDQTSERSADAYVDDADIYAEDDKDYEREHDENYWAVLGEEDEEAQLKGDLGDDPHDTARQLEKNAQLWVYLVELTGGLMAFHKCAVQIVSWMAASGSMIMRSSTSVNYDMTLRNGEGQRRK